jgi:hypothetical protein
MSIATASCLSPGSPRGLAILAEYLRDALDCYPAVSPAELIQQCSKDHTPDQLLAVAVNIITEQADRIFVLHGELASIGSTISDWAEDWNIKDEAIDDLNAKFADPVS